MCSAAPLRDPDLATARGVIAAVRERAPMVHCITAAVSMSIVADGLLAAGARPMMTETAQEAPSVTGLADALLVNLGTLSTDAIDGIPATVAAHPAGTPWVLDPTAIGAAPVRTQLARELLGSGPTVVRANASEVLALLGGPGGRGADSATGSEQAAEASHEVATRTGGVVAVSGRTDLIVGPVPDAAPGSTRGAVRDPLRVHRGDRMLTRVTGTGCLLGALTAACCAVCPDARAAAHAATVWMDVAGERAAARATRPGSFRSALLDALDEIGQEVQDGNAPTSAEPTSSAEPAPPAGSDTSVPARTGVSRPDPGVSGRLGRYGASSPGSASSPGGPSSPRSSRAPLDLHCYLVTSGTDRHTVEVAAQAAAAGAGTIQVRAKDLGAADLLDLVSTLAQAVHTARPATRVIVDDRADVARAAMERGLPVHGVHLGQDDLPVADARAMLGPEAIIGLTTGTLDLVREAHALRRHIDYIGAGPFRPTPTKDSGRRPLGVDGYRELVAATDLPIVAIGDVTPADATDLAGTGVAGLALVRALMGAPDPAAVVREVIAAFPS
jgi:hydroxyethylthiazole kinase